MSNTDQTEPKRQNQTAHIKPNQSVKGYQTKMGKSNQHVQTEPNLILVHFILIFALCKTYETISITVWAMIWMNVCTECSVYSYYRTIHNWILGSPEKINLTFLCPLIAKALSFKEQFWSSRLEQQRNIRNPPGNPKSLENEFPSKGKVSPCTKKGRSSSFKSCKFEEKLCLLQQNISRQKL